MITGLSNLLSVSEKHLEFLLAAAPHVQRVGFPVDPKTSSHLIWLAAAH